MKKNKLINKLLLVCGISLMLLGCSDDEDESTSAGFVSVGSGYREADGTGTIFIPFRDGSISESDIIVDGSATEGTDYTLSFGNDGITVTVIDDDAAEWLETVRFTIPGTEGSANRMHTLVIVSDDPGFLSIELDWPGSPDMDLYLFYRSSPEATWEEVDYSDPGYLELDFRAPDGEYGLAYNYWSGTADPLNFTVTFDPTNSADNITVDGEFEAIAFEAAYTLANVNRFGTVAANGPLRIVQTFTKTGVDFHDFSTITVPESGSRQPSAEVVSVGNREKKKK